MSICPGCGLKLESYNQNLNERYNASSACWQLYYKLSPFTLSLRDSDFIHQLIVDTYTAQHSGPNVKPISTAFALIGLYLTFELGYTGKQVIYTLTAKKSDLQKGILSIASPLGGAVHWRKEGDVVQAGPHNIEYLIEKIE